MKKNCFNRRQFIAAVSTASLAAVIPGNVYSSVSFFSLPASGEPPRTLYKPHDIENARRNVETQPWARQIADGWKRSTEFAVQQDRAFFNSLIPDLTPGSYYGQNCPNCVGKQSVMGEDSIFSWNIKDPDHVTCRRCNMVYPNEQYKETGILEAPRMGQTFTYYEVPGEREDHSKALKWLGNRPVMTSFTGMVRYARGMWAIGQVLDLAKLYALTGDVAYAERTAWILDRFSQVYPGYLFHSYDGTYADAPPLEVAANMGAHGEHSGGKFAKEVIRNAYGLNQLEDHAVLFNGFWGAGRIAVHGKGSDCGPLLNLTIAYDLINDAKYPDGRPVLNAATADRIRKDLILNGCESMEHWNSLSNKGVAVFGLSAAVGALLQNPDRVRHALDGLERIMAERYHFDGFYTETPGYAAHNYANMRDIPDALVGYSDPTGYRPASGERIENLDLYRTGRINQALLAMVRMLAVGSRLPSIGDTPYDMRLDEIFAEILACRLGGDYAGLLEAVQGAPLADKGSEYSLWFRHADLALPADQAKLPIRTEWFPGWQVGVLRGDRPTNDTALFLNGNEHNWTLETHHRQYDILNISYYAFGKEFVPDRGYFSGNGQLTREGLPGQEWVRNSHSHNLVVVDEKNQDHAASGSTLELFGATPAIEVIQASGVNVYPQCDTYRRTVALLKTPDGETLAVDLFRVAGGKVHQYTFHSNGEMKPGTAGTETKLGAEWTKWLKNVRSHEPADAQKFSWNMPDTGLDLFMLNAANSIDRVLVADAPGWRKGSPASELEKPPVQQIIAEKRSAGDAALGLTQFASLIVPRKGNTSPVESARLLANDPAAGVIAVEIKFADRTDIIVSTPDQQSRTFGPVTVSGQFAHVALDGAGKPLQGYLLAGTSLKCGDLEINLPAPSTTLKVRSVNDRTFQLAEPLPADRAGVASYALTAGPPSMDPSTTRRPVTGFKIESAEGNTITVQTYPVLPSDEVTILHSKTVSLKP